MSVEAIKFTLKEYLTEELYFDFAQESDDSDIFETGNIDSLGFINLLTFVQTTYGVKFASSDLRPETFRTVNMIAAFIAARIDASAQN